MNICFLDNNKVGYTHDDLQKNLIRGAERAVINLALTLENLGHKITVLNHTKKKSYFKNVRWLNINEYNESEFFDIAITNNDFRCFDKVKSNKKVAISHSIQTIEKFIRKKQLVSYIKHKPKILLLSNYHKKKRSNLLRIFGSDIISWSVDDLFLNTKLIQVDKKKAIFTSYIDRNLELLISIWKNYIFTKNKEIKLFITPHNKNFSNFNIFNRKFGNQNELINDLISSKVLLVPGHKAELFCIAAEEARELCIPVVTLGIGALSERIKHNITGFIAKNEKQFAEYTLELFNNENKWNEIRNNLIKIRGISNWNKSAKDFLHKL